MLTLLDPAQGSSSTTFHHLCSLHPCIPNSSSQIAPEPINLNLNHDMLTSFAVGKSHKYNDRDHAGLADGTALPTEHLPRYFAKSGHIDADPKKTKKNGAGKGGW